MKTWAASSVFSVVGIHQHRRRMVAAKIPAQPNRRDGDGSMAAAPKTKISSQKRQQQAKMSEYQCGDGSSIRRQLAKQLGGKIKWRQQHQTWHGSGSVAAATSAAAYGE